jgi:hypothetical protein
VNPYRLSGWDSPHEATWTLVWRTPRPRPFRLGKHALSYVETLLRNKWKPAMVDAYFSDSPLFYRLKGVR